MNEKITGLKKVHLKMTLADGNGSNFEVEQTPFNFIYGTASSGLNPFEIELADKVEGDEFKFAMRASELHDKLGHLLKPLKQTLALQILPQELHLNIKVMKVETASEREIIQAMTDALGSSCGGSCDCGCC